MTTYVQKKNRMWLEEKDLKPERRRSESRLKTYPSSTDVRNWCDIVEDRRQHILELICKGIGKCFGKIIPIEVIIDTLLAMANADIAKLKNCMKQLWDFVHGLELTNNDLKKLKEMTAKMDKLCTDLRAAAGVGEKDEVCDEECVAKARQAAEKSEIDDLIKSSLDATEQPVLDGTEQPVLDGTEQPVLDGTEQPAIRTRMQGPAKMVTKLKGLQPGFQVVDDPSKPGHITIKAAGPRRSSSTVAKTNSQIKQQDSNKSASPDRIKRFASGEDVSPDKLAATKALCNEQKDKIEELTKERDDLKKKLDACLNELDNFKKLQTVANPTLPASCQQEIEALEAEINIMRSGNPSPEEEAEIIKKEVEILKRYCTKLKEVESENEKLKVELGSRVAIKDSDADIEPTKIETLKDKLKNLEDLTNERDMLADKVNQLEKQLLQYKDLPNDLEVLKSKSDMLDGALQERDNLCKKVKQMKGIEEELRTFKKKAERVDELERELRNMSKGDRSSGIELRKTQSIAGSLEKELQNIKSEKDAMQKRIESMKKELDSQKAKATEAEMLRLERDRLQIKLNELADIQGQYEEMMNKIKIFDNIKAERDMFKQKYEEVLEMECRCEMLKAQVDEARTMSRERDHLQKQVQDLEACICEQEDEIKGLVLQVESISKTKNDANTQMNSLKDELNEKDRVIAASKEQLAQSQSMTNRIKELEKLLHNAEHKILKKDCHIACLENQMRCQTGSLDAGKKLNKKELDAVKCMGKQLEAAKAENKRLQEVLNKMVSISGDDHMKKILKQSECAVKRVVEELSQQYKDWDHIKTKNPKGKIPSSNKPDCLCHRPGDEVSSGDDCEKLRHELEELQREKQKLEFTVKHLQSQGISSEGLKCPCPRSGL